MKKKVEIFLLSLILLLAFGVRLIHYDQFPVYGESQDEVAWTWLGSSLLKEGIPSAWSKFSAYEGFEYKRVSGFDSLVRPFLDHPPLFSFIPGFVHLATSEWSQIPSVRVIRFPMIFLGTFNVFLLFLVAKKMFPSEKFLALASSLLYATAPIFVFSSRLVLAENLLTSFLLLAILAIHMTSSKRRNIFILIISVLAVLTKVSGVLIPLLFIGVGLFKKEKIWKPATAGLLLGVVLFAIYGFAYNGKLLMQIQVSQAGRAIGLATLYNRIILHPAIVDKFYFDGWMIIGLFSFFYISATTNSKKILPLTLYILLNFLFISLTAGEQTLHGWYDFTIFPLLSMITMMTFFSIIRHKRYILFGVLWLFLLPQIRMMFIHADRLEMLSVPVLRGIVILGCVPLLFSLFTKNTNLPKKFVILLLGTLFLSNIATVAVFQKEIYWISDAYFMSR